MGGIGAFFQALLNSSLSEKVDLLFVITSSQRRVLSASGKATFSNLLEAIKDCTRFARAVLKHRPQVTHIATVFGWSFIKHSVCVMIARASGSRVLIHPHCSFKAIYLERPTWWKWYFRKITKLSHGIITLSSEWDELKEIIPDCAVYSLPNAIDLVPYLPIARKRLENHNKNGDLRVLYLGYLGSTKGSFDLIDAAGELLSNSSNVIFDLVGDELAQGVRQLLEQKILAKNLNGKVNIHQPAFGPEKLAYFQRADVFIYPSYYEGMPMAVLEAMASGLPVVASRVGGLPDLLEDGVNGYLVDPGCPEQLATAIQKILNNDLLLSSMQKQAARIAAERFDIEQLVTKLVEIYEFAD